MPPPPAPPPSEEEPQTASASLCCRLFPSVFSAQLCCRGRVCVLVGGYLQGSLQALTVATHTLRLRPSFVAAAHLCAPATALRPKEG